MSAKRAAISFDVVINSTSLFLLTILDISVIQTSLFLVTGSNERNFIIMSSTDFKKIIFDSSNHS